MSVGEFTHSEFMEADRVLRAARELARSGMDVDRAGVIAERGNAIYQWLNAERRWRMQVQDWLSAEARWKLSQIRFDDPVYAAAKAGWSRLKVYVPRLDGVARFEDLAPALQFRYAAFAAEVNGWELPVEVKSDKQRLAES